MSTLSEESEILSKIWNSETTSPPGIGRPASFHLQSTGTLASFPLFQLRNKTLADLISILGLHGQMLHEISSLSLSWTLSYNRHGGFKLNLERKVKSENIFVLSCFPNNRKRFSPDLAYQEWNVVL